MVRILQVSMKNSFNQSNIRLVRIPFQMRDMRAVGNKFYHVIIPRDGSLLLNDWDLWGPLILCTLLALLLQGHVSTGTCAFL